ncbi:hypothetical protein [Dactylosporangium sp. NPDC051541]|uniref:hypothetical protein n=1 Tax=Dactylosporangium sp. NPDC051541 TaxID=3363977 RepID=UPI0037931695
MFREFPVAVLPPRYRGTPEGSPEQWRQKLLEHVAARTGPLAAELARWDLTATPVTAAGLQGALGMLTARADCADFQAVPVRAGRAQLDNPAGHLDHGDDELVIRAGGHTHRISLRTGRTLP